MSNENEFGAPDPKPTWAEPVPISDIPASPMSAPVITSTAEGRVETINDGSESKTEKSVEPVANTAPEVVEQDMALRSALEFKTPPHNVVIAKSTTTPEESPRLETLVMPAAAPASQEELMRSFPNMKTMSSSKNLQWAQVFIGSLEMGIQDNVLDKALSREGSQWRQGIEIGGDPYRSVIPKKKATTNTELTGDDAVQAAIRHMKIGDLFHAAMWNSGFWVTFKPAPEAVWMDINRQLGMDVAGISRQTYGLLHSSATALSVSTIINAILPHVMATSVDAKEMPVSSIPKYLSAQDEHDFIWGFIAANHPHGFNIQRSCIFDTTKCKHIIEETIQVTEMQVCDWSIFTPEMKSHMHKRTYGAMTLKSVQDYQESLMTRLESSIDMTGMAGETTRVRLRIPTSEQKDRMSAAFVAETQQNMLAVVSKDASPSEKQRIFDENEASAEMRLYQHYVTRIDLGTNSINSPEDIGKVLGEWTRDYELRAKFFEGMSNFINQSSISVIGLEAAVCPNCGQSHSRPEQALRGMVDYIPVDVIQVFSRLAELKNRFISREV